MEPEGAVLEQAFFLVWAALLIGLALSVGIESLMTPRPPVRRSGASWAVHAGVWALAYGLLALILGRLGFAAAVVSAFFLVLVLVNNAKFRSLREPFVFQDHEYFTDMIRYPRLYIPFFGWGKFVIAVLGGVLAVGIGLWAEGAPVSRWAGSGHLGGIVSVLIAGGVLLLFGARRVEAPSFEVSEDLRAFGFLASLWSYARAGRRPPEPSPIFEPGTSASAAALRNRSERPHLVAIQSESFFDPRPLYAGIRPDVLAEFDRLQADALMTGQMTVPAWGANTIRTEFAFLSGIEVERLGVHRFNPYRAVVAGWSVASLASYLKSLGYRTVCVHPYPAGFYQRDRVYPRLGFDAFLDIQAFGGVGHIGPYMDDAAVADKVASILQEATEPTFVMAITMENHGPLHLERVASGDEQALYSEPPPMGCDDLTIYLRHLRNADRMAGSLRQTLEAMDRPASLCWYGDHVPIMPTVYQTYGLPQGRVPYVCWSNRSHSGLQRDLRVEDLARSWLRGVGLMGEGN